MSLQPVLSLVMLRQLQCTKKSVIMPFTTAVLCFVSFDDLASGTLSAAGAAG